jgi:DHA3 family macrolide efflux protein-like MFS transporter
MKNKKALTLLFIANAISGFAQGVSMLAIPWYFTTELNDPGAFGTMYAGVTFLTIFWSLYCGTLVDRFPRKNIFLISSLSGGIILAAVALCGYLTGSIPVLLVMLVFAATMFNYNIHYPTLYAFGQELTTKDYYRKVTSYIEIMGQSTSVLAGAIAAILLSGTDNGIFDLLGIKIHLGFDIPKWDLHDIFLLDATTYFLAFALILFIRYTPVEQLEVDRESIYKRVIAGIKFLKERPMVFIFGNCSYNIFVILLVEIHLLLPLYVDRHLHEGADVYASSEIYYALGALLAGFGTNYLMRFMNEVKAIIAKMLLTTFVLVLCAFTQSVGIFFAISFLIGITNAGTRILRVTWLFHHIPNNLIGRTGGVFHVINILLRSGFIALFSIPFFAQGSNVTWAYFICGVFVLISALPLIYYRKSLEM